MATTIDQQLDTKKSVLDLEAFREMLHISPRIPSQSFAELPSEEEILEFLRNLGHSHEIRHLTVVNVNKLYQPWISFASVINKCLTSKSSGIDSFRLIMATTIEQQTALDVSLVPSTQRLRIGRSNFRLPSDIQSKEATLQVVYDVLRNSPLFRAFQVTADVPEIYMQEFWATSKLHHNSIRKSSGVDSFRLSQVQMLWGFYHRINIDFTYLIWEDFVYQAYKEYHACTMGEVAPKPKASAKKKKGDSASSTTPPSPTPTTIVESAPRLQETHIYQQSGFGIDEGTGSKPGVPDVPSDDSEEELLWNSSDDEDIGESEEEETRQEEDKNFDSIPRTPEESEEESNDE
nr:hypothetical protein [Tanacetum cinerariifolium]